MTAPIELDLCLAATGFRARLDAGCRRDHLVARFGAFQCDALPDDTLDVSVQTDPDFALDRPSRVAYPSSDATREPDGTLLFRRSSERVRFWPDARRAEVFARPTAAHLDPVEAARRDHRVSSIRVLPRVLGLTRSRSRNSATPSS